MSQTPKEKRAPAFSLIGGRLTPRSEVLKAEIKRRENRPVATDVATPEAQSFAPDSDAFKDAVAEATKAAVEQVQAEAAEKAQAEAGEAESKVEANAKADAKAKASTKGMPV